VKIMPAQIKIDLNQLSSSTTEASIRDHRVLIDRPIEKGGADAGPMGGELFLAAVGGCFMSNLLAAIKARDTKITGVHTQVTGTLADSPARFTSLELSVSADSPDRQQLEKLIEIAAGACIMLNTLEAKVELRVRAAEPV
jgi:putative redox protein